MYQILIRTTHSILVCLNRPPPNGRSNLTDSMFTELLPDLFYYINNLPVLSCLVGDINIHFNIPLQSQIKRNMTTPSLNSLVHVANKPTRMCGLIIDWLDVGPGDVILKKSTFTHSLESLHYCIKSCINGSVTKPSSLYRTVGNMTTIDRSSFIAEFSSVSQLSSDKRRTRTVSACALY